MKKLLRDQKGISSFLLGIGWLVILYLLFSYYLFVEESLTMRTNLISASIAAARDAAFAVNNQVMQSRSGSGYLNVNESRALQVANTTLQNNLSAIFRQRGIRVYISSLEIVDRGHREFPARGFAVKLTVKATGSIPTAVGRVPVNMQTVKYAGLKVLR